MTSERPIDMRDHDVRALLAGTKTQHRLPITSVRTTATRETRPGTLRGPNLEKALDLAAGFRCLDGDIWHWTASAFSYQVGARTNWMAHIGYALEQRLWVRESVTQRPMANILTGEPTNAIVAAYAADDEDVVEKAGFNLCPWWTTPGSLPSSRMPRMAGRLTLEVTGVRIQRLQDISEADALAEGCPAQTYEELAGMDPRGWFRDLWDSINGTDAWDANPWVVALTFIAHRVNIDAMEKPHAAA